MKSANKSTFRKTLAVLATIALTISGVGLGATSANAVYVNSTWPATNTYEIGTPLDIDVSCHESYPGEVFGESADQPGLTLPPGITLDSDYHLRGTPTALGDYSPGWIRCFSGADISSNWQNFYVDAIHVIPASTPTPSITLSALNDEFCSIRVVGRMPKNPDPGTASLTFAVSGTDWVATLTGYSADDLIDLTVSASNMSDLSLNQHVGSLSSTGANETNFCDSTITATLAYQYAGAPTATAQATAHATKILTKVQLSAFVEPNTFCSVHLVGSFTNIAPGTNFPIFIGQSGAGYIVYLSKLNEGEMYDVVLPLDDMTNITDDPDIAAYEVWGSGVPACDGAEIGIVATVRMRDSSIGGSELARLYLGSPVPCAPGTWSEDGFVPCADATPGYFVDRAGAQNQTPCNIGYFADTAGSLFCTPAPVARYVATTGATASVACPAGLTTYLPASRSIHECYKLRPQTVKGVKVLKTYKYGTKIITPMLTDGGRALAVTAVGKCTVRVTQITIKVKGKNTKVDRYQIVASKSAGNCSVTYTNAGDDTYAPLRVVKTFKVSKTGK